MGLWGTFTIQTTALVFPLRKLGKHLAVYLHMDFWLEKLIIRKQPGQLGTVAYTYNPGYSGGRDQED
jgi:hypothetical protein